MSTDFSAQELEELVAVCEQDFGSSADWIAPSRHPNSLALRVIDAMFSINVTRRRRDVFDGPPGLAGFDQLDVVQTIDRSGQRIVIGAADHSDRGLNACLGEPLAEPDGRVLRTPVCMVDNIFQIEHTFLFGGSRWLARSRRGPSR